MNTEDTRTTGIDMKHDPYCDCGICAFCNGQEDAYGNSAAIRREPSVEECLNVLGQMFGSRRPILIGHPDRDLTTWQISVGRRHTKAETLSQAMAQVRS